MAGEIDWLVIGKAGFAYREGEKDRLVSEMAGITHREDEKR